jgi:hypothetical protein
MFKFYFSFIFLTMVYSYFRNGRFINGEWTYSLSDYKNKFRAKYPDNIQGGSLFTHIERIVNRFLTTGIVCTRTAIMSEEFVEDLRERVEETQISVANVL